MRVEEHLSADRPVAGREAGAHGGHVARRDLCEQRLITDEARGGGREPSPETTATRAWRDFVRHLPATGDPSSDHEQPIGLAALTVGVHREFRPVTPGTLHARMGVEVVAPPELETLIRTRSDEQQVEGSGIRTQPTGQEQEKARGHRLAQVIGIDALADRRLVDLGRNHVMGGESDYAVLRPGQRGQDGEPTVRDRRPPVGGLRQYLDEGMGFGRDDRSC